MYINMYKNIYISRYRRVYNKYIYIQCKQYISIAKVYNIYILSNAKCICINIYLYMRWQ